MTVVLSTIFGMNFRMTSKAPISLYTASDVKEVRRVLLKQQSGLDALTGLPIPSGQEVCDHCHTTQLVRGILHRQTNVILGKLENLWVRHLAWWYNGTLSEFLRKAADYLDRDQPREFYHPGWIKRAQIDFNKLKVQQKDQVLTSLGSPLCKNDDLRKKEFKNKILTKTFDYTTIQALLQQTKES